ncbi:hypothetical protein VOLCADRAFT_92104 [Volvox carteri f. nagariensis]|uniref:Tyrosine specific protein phosphatases domain-containing protein n=1 Tax=Volvox carteri f. nagariensis TaxID=3068 RepID=D8TYL6_VOLCA|nr:uncharacterized protein VOLCADRAFT_92104 [Volvox carteri f. nagariensis]EFJ47331.1 hypothetical protein VOLCADRAFT_92104 [Volvox carteri f. nagariensis]|eukprot:XP_002951520.1 hypothetical protein VOLCADRAFT_92104 [Volvox carteri f. nagariensis]
MSCKSDVRYNFSRASVEEWSDFMSRHGVQRVVSLLSDTELDTYSEPLPPALAARFRRAVVLDAKAPGAVDKLVTELKDAVDAKEKVLVHCWGGGGRTGIALAAWLVRNHGLIPEQAGSHVEQYSKAQGASRRADVAQLRDFLGSGRDGS